MILREEKLNSCKWLHASRRSEQNCHTVKPKHLSQTVPIKKSQIQNTKWKLGKAAQRTSENWLIIFPQNSKQNLISKGHLDRRSWKREAAGRSLEKFKMTKSILRLSNNNSNRSGITKSTAVVVHKMINTTTTTTTTTNNQTMLQSTKFKQPTCRCLKYFKRKHTTACTNKCRRTKNYTIIVIIITNECLCRHWAAMQTRTLRCWDSTSDLNKFRTKRPKNINERQIDLNDLNLNVQTLI